MDPRPILDPSGLLHQGSDPLDFTDHWGSLTMDSGLQQNFNGLDDGSNGGRVVGQDMQLGDTSLTTGPLAIDPQGSHYNGGMDIDQAPPGTMQPQQAALSKKLPRQSTNQKALKRCQKLYPEAGRKRNCSEMVSPPSSEEDHHHQLQLQQQQQQNFNSSLITPPVPQMPSPGAEPKRMRFDGPNGAFVDNFGNFNLDMHTQPNTSQYAQWALTSNFGAQISAPSAGPVYPAGIDQAPVMARCHSAPQRHQLVGPNYSMSQQLAPAFGNNNSSLQQAFPPLGGSLFPSQTHTGQQSFHHTLTNQPIAAHQFGSGQMADHGQAPTMRFSRSAPPPVQYQRIPLAHNMHQLLNGFAQSSTSWPDDMPVEYFNSGGVFGQQPYLASTSSMTNGIANLAQSSNSGMFPFSLPPHTQTSARNGQEAGNGNMYNHPVPAMPEFGLPTPATGASSSRSEEASTPSGSDVDPFGNHSGVANPAVPEAHREAVCSIKENNKICGKRFRGVDRFANGIEHIRQKHKKNYLPSLAANEENFMKMISMEGVVCPIAVNGAPCGQRFTGRNPWKTAIGHIKDHHPAYFLDNVVANAKGFMQMVNKEENMVCEILKPKAKKQGQEGEPVEWEPCGKRTFGEKTYRSMQEHIRRSHRDEAYIPGLNATRQSIEQMFEKGRLSIALLRDGENQQRSPAQIDMENGQQPAVADQPGLSRQSQESLPASSPQPEEPSPHAQTQTLVSNEDLVGQEQHTVWNEQTQPPQLGDYTTVTPAMLNAPPEDRLSPTVPLNAVQQQEIQPAFQGANDPMMGFFLGDRFDMVSPNASTENLSAFRTAAYYPEQIGVAPHNQTLGPPLFGKQHPQ